MDLHAHHRVLGRRHYTVTATQSDTASNTGTSGPQNITVDKTTPVVTLTSVNGTARTFPYLTQRSRHVRRRRVRRAAGDAATVSISVTGAGSENGAATCTAGAWTYTFVSSLAVNGAYSSPRRRPTPRQHAARAARRRSPSTAPHRSSR